jgi:hypothetical protein
VTHSREDAWALTVAAFCRLRLAPLRVSGAPPKAPPVSGITWSNGSDPTDMCPSELKRLEKAGRG